MTSLVKIDGEEVQLDEFIRVLKLTGQFQELLEQFVRDRLARLLDDGSFVEEAAGVRSEPQRSEPWLSHVSPVASATAAPPEEPPALFLVSHGLRVMPKTALKVLAPAPISGVLVLPTTMPPRASSFSTSGSLSAGMKLWGAVAEGGRPRSIWCVMRAGAHWGCI